MSFNLSTTLIIKVVGYWVAASSLTAEHCKRWPYRLFGRTRQTPGGLRNNFHYVDMFSEKRGQSVLLTKECCELAWNLQGNKSNRILFWKQEGEATGPIFAEIPFQGIEQGRVICTFDAENDAPYTNQQ